MRLSKLLVPTLKEDPADAEVISHKLMVRAGMIRKLTAGIYSYLPLGYRSLRKVEQIVREEMDAAARKKCSCQLSNHRNCGRNRGAGISMGKSCYDSRTDMTGNVALARPTRKS